MANINNNIFRKMYEGVLLLRGEKKKNVVYSQQRFTVIFPHSNMTQKCSDIKW